MLRLLDSCPSRQDDPAADKSRYTPPATPKAHVQCVTLREADWNRHRETITRLYWEENLPLHDVREIMKHDHGFDAS